MKLLAAFDDIDARKGVRTEATSTVLVGIEGQWYELDLSDEHRNELDEVVERYVSAGRKVDGPEPRHFQALPPVDVTDIPRHGRVVLYHAAGITKRVYWKNFREWVGSVGRLDELPRNAIDRTYYYPVDLVEEYEEYLAARDRAQAS